MPRSSPSPTSLVRGVFLVPSSGMYPCAKPRPTRQSLNVYVGVNRGEENGYRASLRCPFSPLCLLLLHDELRRVWQRKPSFLVIRPMYHSLFSNEAICGKLWGSLSSAVSRALIDGAKSLRIATGNALVKRYFCASRPGTNAISTP
jgi:hypothetical protein